MKDYIKFIFRCAYCYMLFWLVAIFIVPYFFFYDSFYDGVPYAWGEIKREYRELKVILAEIPTRCKQGLFNEVIAVI